MVKLSCLCGAVRIEAAKRPDHIHECNCTLCSKTGARWGYFHPSEVRIEGMTRGYRREDKAAPAADIRFCPTCGSTTHFGLTESAIARFGDSLVGINMWLADPADIAGIELRHPDGRAWTGEGDFTYAREHRIIGE